MSTKKHFQECKNILYGLFFFRDADILPIAKMFCEKEKNAALIAGLLTEMLIAVCCSHVTAQRTSLLIGNITLTSGNNVNVRFIFSTIQTVMQNVC